MKILDKIEIIEPYPAIYIDEIDTIAISDTHLGYESIMAEEHGVFVPKVQYKKEVEMVEELVRKHGASRILINGDVKHEFSETSYHEYKEVSDFFDFLKSKFQNVVAIKGNHDNYLIRITKHHGIELHDQLELGDFLFFHGHTMPNLADVKARHLIISHEHPSIALYDEIGVKEKMACFLYGDTSAGRKIVVLPPTSYFALGNDINAMPKEELLSPILKELVDVDELEVIGISPETGCLMFPKLGMLRITA